MGFEFVLSAERLAASGALERFLSRVCPSVSTLRGITRLQDDKFECEISKKNLKNYFKIWMKDIKLPR